MLDSKLTQQLATHLQKIVRPIELVATLDASNTAQQLHELLNEIAALSDNVHYRQDDTRTVIKPSFQIVPAGLQHGPRFAGLPLGHEFTSLVLALLHVGGHPAKEPNELIAQVVASDTPLNFETWYSVSCQICPDVIQALNLLCALNPRITHTAIDGALFQQLASEKNILSLPTVFLNGQLFSQGRVSLTEIMHKAHVGVSGQPVNHYSAETCFDVLIVGSGPAGTAAAIYAARKGFKTLIIGERFGGQMLDTLSIENYISQTQIEGSALVSAMRNHLRDYPVDVIEGEQVSALALAQQVGEPHQLTTTSGMQLRAKTLIIATGARWRTLNVAGEDAYRNRGVAFCPHCDGPLFKNKRVAVVGGGNSGVEAAIDLASIAERVTLIEFTAQLKADQLLQTRLNAIENVDVICNASVTAIQGDDQRVTGLHYLKRDSEQPQYLSLDGVFIQIGLQPNTAWLNHQLTCNQLGEIIINARNESSVPGVFAAGDCTDVPYKQIIIASGEGAKAALSAFDYLIRI